MLQTAHSKAIMNFSGQMQELEVLIVGEIILWYAGLTGDRSKLAMGLAIDFPATLTYIFGSRQKGRFK